jgi:iron(III) transport system substrate-binding protein
LASDPFWIERLKQEGRLLAHVPPTALRLPRTLVDPDGTWTAVRLSTMVIVYNTRQLTADTAPNSYAALAEPSLAHKLIIGDPLASGTFFTTLAFLEDRLGWAYFRRLKANGLVSTGGSSTVIERVASGEFAAGLCLLENVLAAKKSGAPVEAVLPAEGPVLIPGAAAILKSSPNRAAAEAFVDLLLSPEGREVMVRGLMHAPDPRAADPEGAPPQKVVLERALPWSEEFIRRVEATAPALRETYTKEVFR